MLKFTLRPVVALAVSLFAIQGFAQSADDILREAQERAAKIEEYRALLSNPDQNVRVAGLDVMLASDDPAMREIAFNTAFASADDTMRAIALRNKFRYMTTLNFKLSAREDATEGELKALAQTFSNTYVMKLTKYDANTGAINFDKAYGTGQVSGIGMNWNDAYRSCSASLSLGDEPVLEGVMNCSANNGMRGNYPISLTLQ
jgi:hypothetical protein